MKIGEAAGIPSGVIVIWHGTIANIPAGYVICDGNNSTPNLLTRFIQGVATAATDPGATGGATSKDLDDTHVADEAEGGSYLGYNGAAHASNQDLRLVGFAAGLDSMRVENTISDIRPLYYDVAFIMKT